MKVETLSDYVQVGLSSGLLEKPLFTLQQGMWNHW